MKSEKIAKLLASALILDHTKEIGKDRYYKEVFPDTNDAILLKESSIFEFFLMCMALDVYFGKNEKGLEIIKYLSIDYSKKLIEYGFFKNRSDFVIFCESRFEVYRKAYFENKEPNWLYWVSKAFCSYCGAHKDLSKISIIASGIPINEKANLDLIDHLENNYQE